MNCSPFLKKSSTNFYDSFFLSENFGHQSHTKLVSNECQKLDHDCQFHEIFSMDTFETMAESFFNFKVENPKLPRKIVKPLRFRDSADYTTKNTPTTEKEYFENIYNEAFKNVTECLTKRFNQKGLEYYDDLQQYLLLVAKNQPYE